MTFVALEPKVCPACDEVLVDGCPKLHEHRPWDCYGIADMRKLNCGCYAHKECQKVGERCRIHG